MQFRSEKRCTILSNHKANVYKPWQLWLNYTKNVQPLTYYNLDNPITMMLCFSHLAYLVLLHDLVK